MVEENQDSDSEMSISKEDLVETPILNDSNSEIQNNELSYPQNPLDIEGNSEIDNSDSSSNSNDNLNLFNSYLQKVKEKEKDDKEMSNSEEQNIPCEPSPIAFIENKEDQLNSEFIIPNIDGNQDNIMEDSRELGEITPIKDLHQSDYQNYEENSIIDENSEQIIDKFEEK